MSDEWVAKTLGDVAEVLMGQSPPGNSYNSHGQGLPFLQGSAEFGMHTPLPIKWCSEPVKVAEVGDLMVSVRAPVGDTNFADQRIAIGRGLAIVRARQGASTEFLRLVIQNESTALLAASGSGMFSSITAANLRGFKLNLPPLPVQRRIVDLMTHLDAHIANLRAERTFARETLTSAQREEFREVLFGHGVPLRNVMRVHHGWAFPSQHCRDARRDGTPRLIRIGDFARSRESSFDPDRPQEFIGDFPSRFLLDPGDLLVVMTCQTPDGAILGWPMRVPDTGIQYLHNQRIGRIEVWQADQLSMEYVTHMFASGPFNSRLCDTASGTKVLHTSPSKIEEIRLMIPDIRHQHEVAARLDALKLQIEVLANEIHALQKSRRAALSSLLSGQVLLSRSYDEMLPKVA